MAVSDEIVGGIFRHFRVIRPKSLSREADSIN